MSSHNNHDIMQLYLDELLQEPELRPKREPAVASLSQTKPLIEVEKSTEESASQLALEALQKRKLQALLDQQQNVLHEKVKLKESKIGAALAEPKITTITEESATQIAEVELQAKVPGLLNWHENGRPLWAQEAFDVLLFEVSGLTLAVPLIALGQIQNIGEGLTPIFGQSEWFMGLLKSPQGNIKTVNTALFVMPERYNNTFLESAGLVISIDGLPWGLAVDSVNQPSRIHPDEVKWRSNRTKRPWLAGTVKSAMCALIDIPQMGKILSESEK